MDDKTIRILCPRCGVNMQEDHQPLCGSDMADHAVRAELLPEKRREADTNHFGACPHCWGSDGMLNVRSNHFLVCQRCQTYWKIGSNLFSGWTFESEADWESSSQILLSYAEVE